MSARNTRQRDLILETLKMSHRHPTIQELYQEVIQKDPTIGQATVYRNVNRFVESGIIKRLRIQKDVDRYDYIEKDHFHFICLHCGKIIDLYDDNFKTGLDELILKHHLFVTSSDFTVEGYCFDCKKEVSIR